MCGVPLFPTVTEPLAAHVEISAGKEVATLPARAGIPLSHAEALLVLRGQRAVSDTIT
jgi:hypothetical protein